jgi:arylsulfatase
MPSCHPNILFIMTDQQRADAMGCSGGWLDTPNYDCIASQGLRFTQCVANSPVCVPTRLSLHTGLYPHNTGVWRNQPSAPSPDQPTWLQRVHGLGYRTSLFGKTHLHPHSGDLRDREDLMHGYGLDHVDEIGGPRASARVLSHMTAGWQEKEVWQAYQEDYDQRFGNKPHVVRPSALPLEDYADVYVGQRAKEYLEEYDGEEPWFCWVSFGGPHEPWDTPEPYASMYDPSTMPAPRPGPRAAAGRPLGNLDRRLGQRPSLEPGDAAAMRANYAGNVTLIDDQIGQILDVLRTRGELDNTVIVCTSDHGEHNGDAGLIYKETFLDGAVRVPLLVRCPPGMVSVPPGSTCAAPVEWFDIGPTLLELAGGEIDYPQFGRSLRPLLDDPCGPHRQQAVSELGGEIMLLDQRWKAAINCRGEMYMLFDRDNDPEEEHNLAGSADTQQLETELRLRLLEHLAQTQLRGTGYRFLVHG